MISTYYRSSITGVIFNDYELARMKQVIGDKRVNQFLESGVFFELRNLPSIERILNSGGSYVCAISRCREIYPDISAREADNHIKKLKDKVMRARSSCVK